MMGTFPVTMVAKGRSVELDLTTLLKCVSLDFVEADMPMGVYHVTH